ncbi:MAG: TolC family protein [Parabacteroides sp.]
MARKSVIKKEQKKTEHSNEQQAMKSKIEYNMHIYTGIVLLLGFLPAFSQQADSLAWYLETAARNNPLLNSNFALYKASLEKIPQAGAYEDPELDIGVFVKPMETLSGKQIADFTLMQMFPWFGTRKAARNEATEMSRMAYEQFREARNNLFYEVKSQWYQLCNLNEQYKNTQANLALLEQLEKLALQPLFRAVAQCTRLHSYPHYR